MNSGKSAVHAHAGLDEGPFNRQVIANLKGFQGASSGRLPIQDVVHECRDRRIAG